MPTFVLKATFEKDLALNRVTEMLGMGDAPERIAEKVGLGEREMGRIRDGIKGGDMSRLIKDVEKLAKYVMLQKQTDDVKTGNWAFKFMGQKFADKKLAKLDKESRKFGSLLEVPKWFYGFPRVWLLELIRDYALQGSVHGDSEWIDLEVNPIELPLVNMFEKGDFEHARKVITELQKPFADLDPMFVLKELEGHRAIQFNFDQTCVVYEGVVRAQN